MLQYIVNGNALYNYITYSALDLLPVYDSFPWLEDCHREPYSASFRVIRDRDILVYLVREVDRVLDYEIGRLDVVLGEHHV
jgi:hypothetical protein